MHTPTLHTASTIRFRRWSRVGYAIFRSLSCNVSIGALSVSVSDKTLQKSVGISLNNTYYSGLESNSEDKEALELESDIQKKHALILSEITFDNAAACGQLTSYNINCNG